VEITGFVFGNKVIGEHFGIHLLSIVLVKKSTRMFQQTFHSGLKLEDDEIILMSIFLKWVPPVVKPQNKRQLQPEIFTV